MTPRYILALAAAAILLLWNLDYAPVWNPDEGRYISASLEMIAPLDSEQPDWLVPHLNTLPRLNKPPLVYWSAASMFKLIGISVVAARLVPALAAIGVLLLLWRLGARMFDERTGVLAAVVWATCALPFTLARMLSTDMLLAFSITLALAGLYTALVNVRRSASATTIVQPVAFVVAGIGLGLAILSKGPVGVALPLLIALVWMLLVAGGRTFRTPVVLGILGSLALAGFVAAPWFIAIAQVHPEFLGRFLWGENVARLTGGKVYHDPKPIWFFLPVVIVGLLPWALYLWSPLRALAEDFKARLDDSETGATARARLFLWIWAIAIIGLFSLSSTKLITYILPALPPLAMLIAQAFSRRQLEPGAAAVRRANTLTGVLLILLGLLLPMLFLNTKLLGDKIVSTQTALPFVVAMSVILLVGAAALFAWRRPASTLPFVGGALFIAMTGFMGRYALYEDPSPMLQQLQPLLKPGDRIVQFKTFQPSAMFYTRRPSTVVDFVNTSGLDEEEFESGGRFVQTHDTLQKMADGKDRIFVLTRWKHEHWPTLPKMYTIATNNDYRLLSNRPAPAGYHYDHTAPRKRNRELSPACKALAPDC